MPTHDADLTRSCFKIPRFELDIELFIVAFVQSTQKYTQSVGNMYNVLIDTTASVTPTLLQLGYNAELLLENYNLCAHLPDFRQCDKHIIYVIWVLPLP